MKLLRQAGNFIIGEISLKKYITKITRIIHKLFLLLLPNCKYKRKWNMFYRFRHDFKMAGYKVLFLKNKICISGNNILIHGNSENTILTAHGVLCCREYDFFFKENCIVIDIGLNIGITSIFLAQKNNVKKIYAYEPFMPTYQQAIRNLNNNPGIKEKMEFFSFGLGEENKQLTIHYNEDQPGSMSTVSDLYQDSPVIECIEIRQASAVLKEIFDNHLELKKVLKIDCEGAELEILQDLQNNNLLSKIDLILLEWHLGYHEQLKELFLNCGFTFTCRHDIPGKQGVIIACRNELNCNF